MDRARIQLTTTGRGEHTELEGNVRRAFDQMQGQLTAAQVSYDANPADWVGSPPTTVEQALDRLAAAAGAHPVP